MFEAECGRALTCARSHATWAAAGLSRPYHRLGRTRVGPLPSRTPSRAEIEAMTDAQQDLRRSISGYLILGVQGRPGQRSRDSPSHAMPATRIHACGASPVDKPARAATPRSMGQVFSSFRLGGALVAVGDVENGEIHHHRVFHLGAFCGATPGLPLR